MNEYEASSILQSGSEERKGKNYTWWLVVLCFISNLSQAPRLIGNNYVRIAYLVLWLVFLALLVINERGIPFAPFYLPLIFDVLLLVFTVLGPLVGDRSGYLSSNLFRPVNLSTFIMAVGILCGRYISEKQFRKIAVAFIAATFIVAGMIYFDYFRGVDWAGAGTFVYSSKNSAGQILLTAVVLLFLMFAEEREVISYLLSLPLLALVFIMKSRAVIVSAAIIILYIILFVIKQRKYRLIALTLYVGAIVAVLAIPSLHHLFIDQIMLNNKDRTDIWGISSARNEQYEYFFATFPHYKYIGTGGSYIESFPLASLLSYGIIGSVPLFLFSIYPLRVARKSRRTQSLRPYRVLVVALNLMMLLNGVFEEQSPFGPGVKCYLLWLVTGILYGKLFYGERETENNEN